MPATYTLISSNVLASSAASVTFSSIPATYTDLVLRISANGNGSSLLYASINPSNSNHSYRALYGTGTTAASGDTGSGSSLFEMGSIGTATNVFGSTEIYIPNYTVSANKPVSGFGVREINSATSNKISAIAALWSNTSAVTSIEFGTIGGSGFNTGSSFYLYGVKNS